MPPLRLHARAETINLLRTFTPSFVHRRGILPVNTFNVGEEVGKKVIQHVLTPRDGKPLGIAAIWGEVPGPESARILAFVMVTTPPNALIGTVTDRMPAIIQPEHWGIRLGETGAAAGGSRRCWCPTRANSTWPCTQRHRHGRAHPKRER